MSNSRKRAMTWTLVAIGILIVGLGAALIATFPSQQNAFQAGPAPGLGTGPSPGPWYGNVPFHGHAHGWGFHGPRGWYIGGFILLRVLGIAFVVLLAARIFMGTRGRHDGAREIARRRFASGEITEEELRRITEVLDSGGAAQG
jgi:uncharacterized membrane protein